MNNADHALGAGQGDRRAVRRPHHEGGTGACGDGGVRFFRPAGPGMVDNDDPLAVDLVEPGPRSVGQSALGVHGPARRKVRKIAASAATGPNLAAPEQAGQPGARRGRARLFT